MSSEWRARPNSLVWSNPVAWWWGLLTSISGANIAVWFVLYDQFHEPIRSPVSISGFTLLLRELSSVVVGRSVATVAEVCFAAQWAILLHQLGQMTGSGTTLNAAWVVVPLILIAECFSWYAVLTTHYLGNAIENSIWAVAFGVVAIGLGRLVPEFDGAIRAVLVVAIVGIAFYLAFLMTIDVPMYLSRWRADAAIGSKRLRLVEGLRDASTRWVVTHDIVHWKDEIAWMSLYFSMAVWASLALCVFYSLV
jgi:hypothetical protein